MENNLVHQSQHDFLTCTQCYHTILRNSVFCPYCGSLVTSSVKTALIDLKSFINRQYQRGDVRSEREDTLTKINDITNIDDLDLTDPQTAVNFVIDYIVCNIEGFADSLNVIKELNFMDTLSLVREAKADYDRAIVDPEENEYYLRKARNNLECFRAQLSDKFPCLIRRINEIASKKFSFTAGISLSDLRAYYPIIKESICRVTYSAVLDISVAQSLHKKNIEYLISEYQSIYDILSEDTISLLISHDPEQDKAFFEVLPQIKKDIKILADYSSNKTYKGVLK